MRRWLQYRYRISAQLYAGIGGAVLLTIAASLVGLYFFERVGDVQSRVNEGTVPELAAAFGVARYSGTMVAAGPRLSGAAPGDMDGLAASVDEAHGAFESQLAILEQAETSGAHLELVREHAGTLIANLDAIEHDKAELFTLAKRSDEVWAEVAQLRRQLDLVIIPAIDDQLFYTMTGYRTLREPPAESEQHFSAAEFNQYRYLAELQADGNIAVQVLVSAFNLSDASAIEPLRERFVSAQGRVERSLAALQGSPVHGHVGPTLTRLFDLGLADGGGFDLLERRLNLEKRQRELLASNRGIGVGLVVEVDALVAVAEASAAAATRSSAQAFSAGRTLLLIISAVSVGGALLIAWLFVGRVLLRRLQMLSNWMRAMAGGDLEARVEIGGRDEISDMAAALEVFRRHALEVQRLNLVEQLADELQDKNDQLEGVLAELRRAQDQIVMREKLAALGELTAGVAHEIRNPLNFVKNFSEGSEELLNELQETLEENADQFSEEQRSLIDDIASELAENMERIRSHGDRADRIVHDMLLMGRNAGDRQLTDINRLLDQNTRLAYHSARATDPDFQLEWREDLDPEIGEISVVPQELGRVFLNIVGNACDATAEKRTSLGQPGSYQPTVWLTTRRLDEHVQVRIRDNGGGIPPDIVDRVFNPFFTTKPTDRGTGLGLAISSDIVREHGGTIRIESEAGEFTEMIIELPMHAGAPYEPNAEDEATPMGSVV